MGHCLHRSEAHAVGEMQRLNSCSPRHCAQEALSLRKIFRPLVRRGEIVGYPVLLLGSLRSGPQALWDYARGSRCACVPRLIDSVALLGAQMQPDARLEGEKGAPRSPALLALLQHARQLSVRIGQRLSDTARLAAAW